MSFAENLAVLRMGGLPAQFRKPGVNLCAAADRRGVARRIKSFDAAMALLEKLRKHMVAAVSRQQAALANMPPEGSA